MHDKKISDTITEMTDQTTPPPMQSAPQATPPAVSQPTAPQIPDPTPAVPAQQIQPIPPQEPIQQTSPQAQVSQPAKLSPEDQIKARQKFLEEERAKNEELLGVLEKSAQKAKQEKPTNDMESLVVDVEKDLLYHIMVGMRQREISTEEAKALAKSFLEALPYQDKKALLEKLYVLGAQEAAVKEVYLKYATPYFQQERDQKIQQMSELIKTGNIEQAIAVAKGGTT